MASNIQFSQAPSPFLAEVLVLRIQGTIDSDTAPLFEKKLEALLAENHHRLLVDLSQVDYVSSAGIGVFISMLQRFRDQPEGDLKATGAAKKIMAVFDAIGLTEMMEFVEPAAVLKVWQVTPKIVEALDHFSLAVINPGELYSGEKFTLRAEALDANQNRVMDYRGKPKMKVSRGLAFPAELAGFKEGVWEGTITLTASGKISLTLIEDQHPGTLELALLEKSEKAVFPLTVTCHTCQTPMTVNEPDIYRCENCDETFYLDAQAKIFTLKPGNLVKRRVSRYKTMEMKINADVNYLGVIRQTISGLCAKEGMDDVTTNAVALAIDEILLNLIEHGNDFDPWQIFKLRMDFQKRQVKIQIRDYGDPYDITKYKDVSIKSSVVKGLKRGVGTFLVHQLMDQVKYESRKNFNQLTMIKQFAKEDQKD